MRVTLLCSDINHPIYDLLLKWANNCNYAHVEIINFGKDAKGGDFLFLISCTEIIKADVRSHYRHTLVIHASDLPHGRGWSPQIWAVIEGKTSFTATILEAENSVDSGNIWAQKEVLLEGHELYDEINNLWFAAEFELIEYAIKNVDTISPRQQSNIGATYYRRRVPDDSRIDPIYSIADQFNLLRVCDNNRYPAFFDYKGYRYEISIRKRKG